MDKNTMNLAASSKPFETHGTRRENIQSTTKRSGLIRSTFLQLPPEILLNHLVPLLHRSTISSLASCNHQLNDMLQPVLFRVIDFAITARLPYVEDRSGPTKRAMRHAIEKELIQFRRLQNSERNILSMVKALRFEIRTVHTSPGHGTLPDPSPNENPHLLELEKKLYKGRTLEKAPGYFSSVWSLASFFPELEIIMLPMLDTYHLSVVCGMHRNNEELEKYFEPMSEGWYGRFFELKSLFKSISFMKMLFCSLFISCPLLRRFYVRLDQTYLDDNYSVSRRCAEMTMFIQKCAARSFKHIGKPCLLEAVDFKLKPFIGGMTHHMTVEAVPNMWLQLNDDHDLSKFVEEWVFPTNCFPGGYKRREMSRKDLGFDEEVAKMRRKVVMRDSAEIDYANVKYQKRREDAENDKPRVHIVKKEDVLKMKWPVN